jgi:hypothetical protein
MRISRPRSSCVVKLIRMHSSKQKMVSRTALRMAARAARVGAVASVIRAPAGDQPNQVAPSSGLTVGIVRRVTTTPGGRFVRRETREAMQRRSCPQRLRARRISLGHKASARRSTVDHKAGLCESTPVVGADLDMAHQRIGGGHLGRAAPFVGQSRTPGIRRR